jgi:UDP-2,3-diacylglucosamine pyrophosphatase LpxH
MPEQIRIQYTGRDDTEMVITYTTGSSVSRTDAYTKAPPTTCLYGAASSKTNTTVKGTSHYFEVDKYSADIHQCILSKLQAGVEYYYVVGDKDSPNGLSKPYSFVAGAVKKWAVFGDYGWTNMDKSASQLLKDGADGVFDGVLHVGDIAYDLHNGHGQRGDDFMNYLESITATKPYLLQPGNHEKFENFTHYSNRFAALQHLGDNSGSDTLLWYSFNQPNAHFITFDTEVYSYYPDPEQIARQLRWMEEDLIKYNTPEMRKKYPWIISVAHKCDWQDEVKYNDFRDLLNKYGVDVHICGHQHNYQRLYPGLRSKVDAQPSPNVFIDPPHWVQIVVGSPGCQEKISSGLAPYRDGVASHYFSYGFGLLEIVNGTHINWEWKQTHAADSSRGETLFDQAMIAMQLDTGSKIKDTMTLIQRNHGMRDV